MKRLDSGALPNQGPQPYMDTLRKVACGFWNKLLRRNSISWVWIGLHIYIVEWKGPDRWRNILQCCPRVKRCLARSVSLIRALGFKLSALNSILSATFWRNSAPCSGGSVLHQTWVWPRVLIAVQFLKSYLKCVNLEQYGEGRGMIFFIPKLIHMKTRRRANASISDGHQMEKAFGFLS